MSNKRQYKTKTGAMRGARKLLDKLQARIDNNPDSFCENYGQSEILDFEQRLSKLHYIDKCEVMEILFKVSSMTPNKKPGIANHRSPFGVFS